MRSLFIKLLFTIVSLGLVGCVHGTGPQYGRWEKYSTPEPVKFADFDLYFNGTRPNLFPGETERRLGDDYAFEARKGSESVEILWSSGLGDIGPTEFSIGGRAYMLEMEASDILGHGFMDSSHVVVWPLEEFEARRRGPWWKLW